jgi:hypothetical protein
MQVPADCGIFLRKRGIALRLPLEKVLDLYNNSYNPRCRRFANRNSYQDSKLALTMFQQVSPS